MSTQAPARRTWINGSKKSAVYVTAFPTRRIACKYMPEIAWETEVWIADAPSHLTHFNGVRFLGPDPRQAV